MDNPERLEDIKFDEKAKAMLLMEVELFGTKIFDEIQEEMEQKPK